MQVIGNIGYGYFALLSETSKIRLELQKRTDLKMKSIHD
jgi:hypothetical protein